MVRPDMSIAERDGERGHVCIRGGMAWVGAIRHVGAVRKGTVWRVCARRTGVERFGLSVEVWCGRVWIGPLRLYD